MNCSTLNAATLLAFLVGLGVAAPAHGQSSSVVLVLGADQSPSSTEAIRTLRTQIAANPRLSLVPGTELTRALVGALPEPTPAGTGSQEIGERLSNADDAIAKFDFDRALIQIFRAERPLIDQRPDRQTRKGLADVNFKLGLVYLAQGDRDRARQAFGAVHFLMPATELDPARYPPDVVGAFERARPGPNADSTLSVSGLEGAAVFVDGRPVATAPAEVEVPAGVHYVLMAKPGYRASGRRVETQPGGVEPVRIPLGPLPVVTRAHQLRRDLAQRTAQLRADIINAGRRAATMTGAEVAIVLTRRGDQLTAIAIGRQKIGSSFSMPAQIAALLDELAPPPIEIPRPIGGDDGPWFRRPWALAAMGGAALAVISVTTVVLLSGGDDMRPSGGFCFPPDC